MAGTSIYALHDPRVSPIEWRYVGKTMRSVKDRLREHIYYSRNDATTPVQFWTRKLLQGGVKPVLVVLESVPDGGDWEEAERRWVKTLRDTPGCRLLNLTDGGDGTAGWDPPESWYENLRQPKTEEHKRKIGDGNRGTVRLDMRGENNPMNRIKREDPERYKRMGEASSRRQKGVPKPTTSASNRRRKGEKRSLEDRKNTSIGVSRACTRRGHEDLSRAAKKGWVTRRAKKAARLLEHG